MLDTLDQTETRHPIRERDATHGPRTAVWDLALRLFHWVFAGLVLAALVTGFYAPEWWLDRHLWIGYGIAVLLVFRLVWGFYGGHHARFADFCFSPRTTLGHVRELRGGQAFRHLGHNPAGALMVFAMLALVTFMVIGGFAILGGVEKEGPFAGVTDFETGWWLLGLHRAGGFAIAAMIVLHLGGVWLQSCLEGENLATAMITGRKSSPGGARDDGGRVGARPGFALALSLLIGIGLAIPATLLAARPAIGYRTLSPPAVFASECGECHTAFHPSLLPARSWRAIMAGLEAHFGEDASLDSETRNQIETFLVANASRTWDTKAAHFFRRVDPDQPLRITHTPGWQARHAGLDHKLFAQKNIASRANCTACHGDARSGLFADRRIRVPAPDTRSKNQTK